MDKERLKEHRELEFLRSVGDLHRGQRRNAKKADLQKYNQRISNRWKKLRKI